MSYRDITVHLTLDPRNNARTQLAIALARRFATGKTPDRYAGLQVHYAPGGTPMLDGHCAAWFECHNRSRYEEGDHVIFVGEVERCGVCEDLAHAPPLVYHGGGFHQIEPL